jgi:hypothetical protein
MSIIQGFIGAVSNTNNVRYTIVPDYTYIDEGGTASAQTVTYTITTTGVDDGTTLYWNNGGTTVAADIGGSNTGSVTISGGSATISLTATADTTTEGTETIIIRLYTDSGRTQLVATAQTVTVGDTSLDPPIPGSAIFVPGDPGSYLRTDPTGSYGGSAQFVRDSGQYLSATVAAPGTGNVTYEWWFYQTTNTGQHGMLQTRTGTTGADGIDVSIGNYQIVVTKSGSVLFQGGTVTTGFWFHIALVRAGSTTWTVYLNGLSIGTFDFADTTSTDLYIGEKSADTPIECFDGYITNFRYVKGTAVYTQNFTPRTDVSAAIGGTELLLLTTTSPNLLVDSSSNNLTVTNHNGVAFASTTPVTYYDFNLGSTYTIEFWMKPNAASDAQEGLVCQDGWFGAIGAYASYNRENAILVARLGGQLAIGQCNSYDMIYYTEPASGEWTHVAVVNTAGTTKVYYNGIEQTQLGSSVPHTAAYTNINLPLFIGHLGAGYNGAFNGKLTNIRITNTAIYSANFSPPYTQPTIVGGHTKLLWTPTQYSITTDGGDHATAITNNGATADTDYPQPITHGSAVFDNTPKNLAVLGSLSVTATTASANANLGAPPYTAGSYAYFANIASGIPVGATFTADGQTCTVEEVSGSGDYIFVGFTPRITEGALQPGDSVTFAFSNLNLSTTWTIEWWQKADLATTSGNLLTILCQGPGNINSGRIDIFCQNGNLYVGNGNSIGAEPTPGVWTHVALVSNSGVLTVYYNGVQQFSSLINYSITSTQDVYIGKRGPSVSGQNFRGKLTNIHIVNTADKYTAAFIPAVLPLKITGTKLLWTPTNRSIVRDSSDHVAPITNTGSVAYNSDYPYEFAYEAIHPHSGAGILTMTKSINGLSVQAGATNFDDTPAAGSYITIDGVTVASDSSIGIGQLMTRGQTMVVVNKETNTIESIHTWDTWGSPGYPAIIEAPLSNVTNGRIVILVSYDATSCTSNMRNILVNSYGASTPGSYATWTQERVSHLFIGVKR